MNNNLFLQRQQDVSLRPLAPVIPLKAVIKEENKQNRKNIKKSKPEVEPVSHEKAIFRSKKYDLL